jgi:hypothetical protein
MATEYMIRPWERQLFLGCRRAWDFGAHERQGLEAAGPAGFVDLQQAVKDALAVYHFPGMWDWNRAIVAPLATEGFNKALRNQGLTDDAAAAAGRRLLAAYYDWAPTVDNWSPVQVEALFDVTVPDPAQPGSGLLTADGRGVLYRLRVDLVVLDKAGRYWIVEHRLCPDGFAGMEDLLLDDTALTRAWAWELGFLSPVAGTIHNELRLPRPGEPGPDDTAPAAGPPPVEVINLGSRHVRRYNGPWFRRTRIRRTRAEIEAAGVRVAEQSRLMARADIACYPTPEWSRCRPCEFREPCLALMEGTDPEPVLRDRYRARPRRDFEEGRLGSVWGFVPHRADHTHVRLNPPGGEPGHS